MAVRARAVVSRTRRPRARAGLTIALLIGTTLPISAPHAQSFPDTNTTPRARDLGVPFDGTPGPLNAITDVAGVQVGHITLISGNGPLVVGKGPVRTGVTAILPRGRTSTEPVFANWASLNGYGEMTGTTWVEESGYLAGPVMITNTNSVGTVRDAVIEWQYKHLPGADWGLPVVAETWDGALNDGYGFHVSREDAFAAIESARGGPVAEGNVGGGTGMICHEFKGGIGTSSRVLSIRDGGYTVGVLVQCNYGQRRLLRIAGAPVGSEMPTPLPCFLHAVAAHTRWGTCDHPASSHQDAGSIIVVVATNAPLLPQQLRAVAKRVTLALGKTGSLGGDGSGDLFLAFSTAPTHGDDTALTHSVTMLRNQRLDPVFEATIQATEEAVVNALVAARTMVGRDDFQVPALPHDRLRAALAKYGRLRTAP